MKAKGNQMVIVVLLLVVITSIVVYTWIGIAELMSSFNHVASETLTTIRIPGL
ncbi:MULTISPECIES: hypothetical protein [Odoribacteraceae]|uniref:hypothetical protein n=1 Tax=Odoribacteraceae TaxID=1853231 RepID=UPI0013148292|nr:MULTISPECIES: hypothetical protein [Odoribacteraceae]MCQ4874609.1 hypothetical protein [Butyricimonas paravirosa]